MFCIKCGKSTQEEKVVCESCGYGTGFGTISIRRIKENKKIGMYLTVMGNIFFLIGLMISGILIKTDAPVNYVAEVFEPTYYDVKEWTEEQLAEFKTEEEIKKAKEETEAKGYAYSILEYTTRKSLMQTDLEVKETDSAQVKKEKEQLLKDAAVLQKVSGYLASINKENIVWTDDGDKKDITAYFTGNSDQEAIDIIEKYNESDMIGLVFIVIAFLAGIGAIILAVFYEFKFSILCTLISTLPIWYMFVKLEGNMKWEYMNGMYVFVIGLFMCMFGVLVGGNTDKCNNCNLILPGGAAFCYKCGEQKVGMKKSPKFIEDFQTNIWKKWAFLIGIIGNVIMFGYTLIPHMKTLKGKETVNVIGLRGVISEGSFTNNLITIAIVLCCVCLIGAVVTGIYEKVMISIGCSMAACAMILGIMYLVQDAVDIGYTFYIFAVGFIIAMAAGISKLKETNQ